MSRMSKGFELAMKGRVSTFYNDEEVMIFEVRGSDKNGYSVNFMEDGFCFCDCWDYKSRHRKGESSFMCKHIWACIFHLGILRLAGQQTLASVMEAML